MPSEYQEFWNSSSFAFVAHSARKPFPGLSYGELKKQADRDLRGDVRQAAPWVPRDPQVDQSAAAQVLIAFSG